MLKDLIETVNTNIHHEYDSQILQIKESLQS